MSCGAGLAFAFDSPRSWSVPPGPGPMRYAFLGLTSSARHIILIGGSTSPAVLDRLGRDRVLFTEVPRKRGSQKVRRLGRAGFFRLLRWGNDAKLLHQF